MTSKLNPMENERELSILIKMSVPAMISMLVQSIYNLADSFFVSQISEQALRAVSLSFSISLIIIGIAVGTSIGVNSYISRKLGEKNFKEANNGIINGIILLFISWIIFIIFRFIYIDKFYHLFTSDEIVVKMGVDYLGIVSFFCIFVFYQILGEKIMQSIGKMKIAMLSHLISAITNIILDPLLIHGYLFFPKLGIRGAAIATVFSQFIGLVFISVYMFKNRKKTRLSIRNGKINIDTIKEIYRVGFPSILINSIGAILQVFVNMVLGGINELAITVLGIYIKLQSFIFMPIFGLGQGFLPLIGYNYGARKKDRIKNIYKYAFRISLVFSIIGFIIFRLFPGELIYIFTDDLQVFDIGIPAFKILSYVVLFAPISILNSTFYQGLGIGSYGLIITIVRQFLLVLPLTYIFASFGLVYIWLAFPIAEMVGLLMSVYYKEKLMKNKIGSL